MATNTVVTKETPITLKVLYEGETRRFKVRLDELGANSLPTKLRAFLNIPAEKNATFERYSDSAQRYVVLATHDVAVWKQLWRAAKAKLKLRLKVTAVPAPEVQEVKETPQEAQSEVAKPQRREPDAIRAIINAQTALYGRANASETTLRPEALPARPKAEAEAPVPEPFVVNEVPKTNIPVLRPCEAMPPLTAFTVHCNNCNDTISNLHWHCGICEEGDYDLCPNCIDFGVHCEIDSHFLIKRSIENGRVVNSTMETATRTPIVAGTTEKAPVEVKEDIESEMTRTCNCCVNSFEESNFVTCLVCDDYDLCIPCHLSLKHGHHPSHPFMPVAPAGKDAKVLDLCTPGRNVRHLATCDGCNKAIVGVRHKCMNCPDFDFCQTCVLSATHIHPGHRFAPLYEPIGLPNNRVAIHYSIRCDGPLCKNKMNFLRGDRYKCAVCDDIDFCSACEALPFNPHNRTHPLIKFVTPVRNVMVTTYGERENGETMVTMGDRTPMRSQSTETTAAPSANAATQVQTVAEVKPEPAKEPAKKAQKALEPAKKPSPPIADLAAQLEAHFVRDSIPDGQIVVPGIAIEQTWSLRNPGPCEWPAGCCVRYIGGDYMLNVDDRRPSSLSDLDRAIQSNTIDTPVAVGAEVQFTVKLKTPQRAGKAISYWRLKTPDGMPFGHKLWCDVDVKVTPAPALAHNSPKANSDPVGPVKNTALADYRAYLDKDEEKTKAILAEKLHESQMVFPKLDKESPVNSTHETEKEQLSTAASTTTTTEVQDQEDDLESLGMADDETDDAFLTDEEYEILETGSGEEAANGRK